MFEPLFTFSVSPSLSPSHSLPLSRFPPLSPWLPVAPPASPACSASVSLPSVPVCLSRRLFLPRYLPPFSVPLSPSRCGHDPGFPEMRFRNVSFLTALLFGLSGLLSLSWYTAFSSSRGKTRSPAAVGWGVGGALQLEACVGIHVCT